MDVLICGDPEHPEAEEEAGKTIDNYLRARDLRSYYKNTNSIAAEMYGHPEVTLRYVVKQTAQHMSGLSELNFEGEFTQAAQS